MTTLSFSAELISLFNLPSPPAALAAKKEQQLTQAGIDFLNNASPQFPEKSLVFVDGKVLTYLDTPYPPPFIESDS